MFRIKTDIRQYKCESKGKVEKLIRNWVIRPTDLIYNTDEKEWLPIGQHPAFVKLFGVLEEHERNTPDTVVQRGATRTVNGTEVAAEPSDEEVEEVTQLAQRPKFDDDEDEDEAIASADAADGDEAADDAAVVEEPTPGVPLDARETDVFDQEEIARSLTEDQPSVPEAPDGVEPPARDDEVTMMTEKTLDMLKITDEDEAVEEAGDAESEEVTDVRARPKKPEPEEESTQVTEAPSATDEEEESLEDEERSVPEAAVLKGSRKLSSPGLKIEPPEESDEHEEDELETREETREDEGEESEEDESAAPDSEDEDALAVGEEEEDEGPDEEAVAPKLGRHNLPEEFFATNEISSPALSASDPIDDLATLTDEEREAHEEALAAERDADLDDEPSEPTDDESRITDELEEEEVEAAGKRDEVGDDETPKAIASKEEYAYEGEWEEESEEEWDEEDDIPVHPVAEFISDGYKIPMPFTIGPTARDIANGLKLSEVSEKRKDATYPLPVPKKTKEPHVRRFDLDPAPPADRSVAVILGICLILAVLVLLYGTCAT